MGPAASCRDSGKPTFWSTRTIGRSTITHFSAERVPVSLGIVLDTSGSMAGEKLRTARAAIERFLAQLLNPDDEVFLYGFASEVRLLQDWTTNREAVSASLRGVRASGGTAMYDAVVGAVPKAESGRHRKKAVVLMSDGDDTNSRTGLAEVRTAVRETEVLVYAIGIDGEDGPRARPQPSRPRPIPFPIPGRRRAPWPVFPQSPPTIGRFGWSRLNVSALRAITDESGGRTEIVRNAGDLNPATASIADELSRQYYLGYSSPGHRDGRWHTIRVEARDRSFRVRARRGYIATSPIAPTLRPRCTDASVDDCTDQPVYGCTDQPVYVVTAVVSKRSGRLS